MTNESGSTYRNAPKREHEPSKESAAELKAKADLLKLLGVESTIHIRNWLKQSPFAEALKRDGTILSHVRLEFQKRIRTDEGLAFLDIVRAFPAAKNPEFLEVARKVALDKLSVLKGMGSRHAISCLEDVFDLKHDSEYLKGLVPIVTDKIRHGELKMADSMLGNFDVPTDDKGFRGWAKIGANKMLLEGKIPEGFLKRFPELAQDDEVRGSVKLLARKFLAKDAFDSFEELSKIVGNIEGDPDIRKAMILAKARLIASDKASRFFTSLSYSERREAEHLALLDILVKGIPDNDDERFILQLDRSDPRVEPAIKLGIYNSKPSASIELLGKFIGRFPNLAKDPKVEASVKAILMHNLKARRKNVHPYSRDAIDQFIKKDTSVLILFAHFPGLLQDAEVQDALKNA